MCGVWNLRGFIVTDTLGSMKFIQYANSSTVRRPKYGTEKPTAEREYRPSRRTQAAILVALDELATGATLNV